MPANQTAPPRLNFSAWRPGATAMALSVCAVVGPVVALHTEPRHQNA